MPDIGSFHPQVVHFVIGILIIGVLARVVSLFPLGPTFSFTGAMAATLIFIGTAASVVAVKSGLEAHEHVETIPGVRAEVERHEDAGKDTRNIFLVVSALEIGILVSANRKAGLAKSLRVLSAVVGVAGVTALYTAAQRGGDLVYSYAGGVGTRTVDTASVRRLLVAGLYNNVQIDRQAGRRDEAARLVDLLQQMMPNDTSVMLMHVQSLLRDRGQPQQALAALDSLTVPNTSRRWRTQKAMLIAESLDSAGMRDSARVVLSTLKQDVPQAGRMVDQMLQQMK